MSTKGMLLDACKVMRGTVDDDVFFFWVRDHLSLVLNRFSWSEPRVNSVVSHSQPRPRPHPQVVSRVHKSCYDCQLEQNLVLRVQNAFILSMGSPLPPLFLSPRPKTVLRKTYYKIERADLSDRILVNGFTFDRSDSGERGPALHGV